MVKGFGDIKNFLQDNDDRVTSEFQSFRDLDSPNLNTLNHQLHYIEGEIYDETNINDICDSSTYDIAEEFYYDLEYSITDYIKEDTVLSTSYSKSSNFNESLLCSSTSSNTDETSTCSSSCDELSYTHNYYKI